MVRKTAQHLRGKLVVIIKLQITLQDISI